MLISKRRWVHALSYEVILLVIIALALSYVFEMPMQVTGGLGIAMAMTSVLWNMFFNHYFEKFQVRRSKLILNHIFAALMAYVEIQKNQFERIFENVYRWQKKLFRPMIKNFIDDFILDKNHLLPQRIYK